MFFFFFRLGGIEDCTITLHSVVLSLLLTVKMKVKAFCSFFHLESNLGSADLAFLLETCDISFVFFEERCKHRVQILIFRNRVKGMQTKDI
jgi:hypothetical protein